MCIYIYIYVLRSECLPSELAGCIWSYRRPRRKRSPRARLSLSLSISISIYLSLSPSLSLYIYIYTYLYTYYDYVYRYYLCLSLYMHIYIYMYTHTWLVSLLSECLLVPLSSAPAPECLESWPTVTVHSFIQRTAHAEEVSRTSAGRCRPNYNIFASLTEV